ncbi:UNKNOWN [Stylonychia lemnae]|uniref:Uncharacterized protein n=1 Tax=Stylonychia lemnae TaxID=5949 RepID=A0A078B8H1_STYLE|nr:UNKNOWN [Stylonychia lemnae]|eukprot:CDW90815.1 UNKNOWN [Stylonychia lemnae]
MNQADEELDQRSSPSQRLNANQSRERFFSRLNLKPFKIIISNDGKQNYMQKRKSAGVGFNNCVSEDYLFKDDPFRQGLNDIFITRVSTLADYFNLNQQSNTQDDMNTQEDTEALNRESQDAQEEDNIPFDDKIPADYQDDLHKARTLISSRMDDRILNSINKSHWSKQQKCSLQNPQMARTQTAGNPLNMRSEQSQKPKYTYGDVIAMKYINQEEKAKNKKRKNKRSIVERSNTAAVGFRESKSLGANSNLNRRFQDIFDDEIVIKDDEQQQLYAKQESDPYKNLKQEQSDRISNLSKANQQVKSSIHKYSEESKKQQIINQSSYKQFYDQNNSNANKNSQEYSNLFIIENKKHQRFQRGSDGSGAFPQSTKISSQVSTPLCEILSQSSQKRIPMQPPQTYNQWQYKRFDIQSQCNQRYPSQQKPLQQQQQIQQSSQQSQHQSLQRQESSDIYSTEVKVMHKRTIGTSSLQKRQSLYSKTGGGSGSQNSLVAKQGQFSNVSFARKNMQNNWLNFRTNENESIQQQI